MIDFLQRLDAPLVSDSTVSLEKAAQLKRRQDDLSDAPTSDFALAIFDGHQTHRKYPVKTAADVALSKDALEAAAAELPAEVVKTARFFIDLASREHCGAPAYKTDPETGEALEVAHTNVVYTGHVDHREYVQKLASRKTDAPGEEALIGGRFYVLDAAGVREAERHFEIGFDADMAKTASAAVQLVKRAEHLGVTPESREVTRFDRTSVPAGFDDQIAYRRSNSPEVLRSYWDDLSKEASSARTREDVLEVAQCVALLDRYAGLTPADNEKTASANSAAFGGRVLVDGTPGAYDLVFPFEEAEATEADLSKVASVFGDEFADRLRSDRKAATESLQPSERMLLGRLVA